MRTPTSPSSPPNSRTGVHSENRFNAVLRGVVVEAEAEREQEADQGRDPECPGERKRLRLLERGDLPRPEKQPLPGSVAPKMNGTGTEESEARRQSPPQSRQRHRPGAAPRATSQAPRTRPRLISPMPCDCPEGRPVSVRASETDSRAPLRSCGQCHDLIRREQKRDQASQSTSGIGHRQRRPTIARYTMGRQESSASDSVK